MAVVTDIHPNVVSPPRYNYPWRRPFDENIQARLRPGMSILDIGSGQRPTLVADERPPDTRYVGLDASRDELVKAGEGAYDELVVADAATRMSALDGTIDLAVSWQVFEHVKPLEAALDNVFHYLRPGGTLVSLFSGGWSVFGVVNRALPDAIGGRLVERSMRRRDSDQPVFPAYYDGCSYRSLRRMTEQWHTVEIQPLFRAAVYFHFSEALSKAYLAYENAVHRARLKNLATHYLLVAQK